MPLTSTIRDYDSAWKNGFEVEAARIRPSFAEALVEIHHVGSTAVEGLAAKPEIDILVVVATAHADTDWSTALSGFGYRRGGDLSPGHQFYKRDVDGVRTHKVHVCVVGHPQIATMLAFRDALRARPRLRDEYAALKRQLELSNTAGIGEYLDRNAPFIATALQFNAGADTRLDDAYESPTKNGPA